MVGGFLLLALVSASLAALFVSDEERPREQREESAEAAILTALARLEERLAELEARMAPVNDAAGGVRGPLPDRVREDAEEGQGNASRGSGA